MLSQKNNHPIPAFQILSGRSAIYATAGCVLFLGLILLGPLDVMSLRRYCLGHPINILATEVFFVAMVALLQKYLAVRSQSSQNTSATAALNELTLGQSAALESVPLQLRSDWLHNHWQVQGSAICESWLGQRVESVIQGPITTENSKELNVTLSELARRDQDQLNQSYWLVRYAIWVLPLMGAIGTSMVISDTLWQTDIQNLFSHTAEVSGAIKTNVQLAFNCLIIAFVYATIAKLAYVAVRHVETSLLQTIDKTISTAMHQLFAYKANSVGLSEQETLVKTQSADLASEDAVVSPTPSLAYVDMLEESLTKAFESAVTKYESALSGHVERITRIQSEREASIDSRWQQWQISLSEKARALHEQQRQMLLQTELLNQLIDKHNAIRAMEQPIQSVLERLTDVDRFHDAAICLTEAIAVLGTQLERSGHLGRTIARRHSAHELGVSDAAIANSSDNDTPATLPLKRRAG